tara:strand:+ start:25 stop:456 length:432 start_codon:yes stop_codon:yes gene_type:complete
MNLRRKYRTKYIKKGLTCLTVDDYLALLENVKQKNQNKHGVITFNARCPLHHNHPNGDKTPSLLISEGVTQPVVYYCQSQGGQHGPCNNRNLTNWFVRQFKKSKKLYTYGYGYAYSTHDKVKVETPISRALRERVKRLEAGDE